MTTSAFLNGMSFKYVDTSNSPNARAIPEVISCSGLGQVNPLVDATSFDSSAREYIAGLADGQEITMECVYLPDNTVQAAMRTAITNKLTKALRVIATDSTHSPTRVETFDFSVVMLGWVINPSYEDKNTVTFTFKISGAITIT